MPRPYYRYVHVTPVHLLQDHCPSICQSQWHTTKLMRGHGLSAHRPGHARYPRRPQESCCPFDVAVPVVACAARVLLFD
ncbi:hypothetical protein LZ31DRAFT_163265 [Colletotrichum somersetense]|nr:hypothetical protein LZ31DRAFT_163265 [Colletotrichum somersetense]